MYVYLIVTKAVHSSAFPALFYYVGIVRHFDTVNYLDIRWILWGVISAKTFL